MIKSKAKRQSTVACRVLVALLSFKPGSKVDRRELAKRAGVSVEDMLKVIGDIGRAEQRDNRR